MPGWKKIGDVARDVTKKLEEPFAVALCFREWAPASNGSDFAGIVAFNHPRDWSPTADERAEVDDCCEDVAQQIYEGKLQGGQGFVLWGEPMTPATKEITRQITRTQKTLAAWCQRRCNRRLGILQRCPRGTTRAVSRSARLSDADH